MNDIDSSSPKKKRKIDDGDEAVGTGNKLATLSSLESRYEELNASCRFLENMLKNREKERDYLKKQIDYLLKNQSWEYSAEIHSYDWVDDPDHAAYLVKLAEKLKGNTIKMREGEFPYEEKGKGIVLHMDDEEDYTSYSSDELLPHWKEFAAAIKQFTPAIELLPDNCESYFTFGEFRLKKDIIMLIKEALMGIPFTELVFHHNFDVDDGCGGLSVDAILDIAESNKNLRNLGIFHNCILSQHIDRLCAVVFNHPLVELELWDSLDDSDVGNSMLTLLLTSGELKLQYLGMSNCHINSDACRVLADFIAANIKLTELYLKGNELNDSDAALIANALRSNATLEVLDLRYNDITDDGFESAFRPVMYDKSSLNAVADSNHCCYFHEMPEIDFNLNWFKERGDNRGRKIYSLLSERHITMSNVQYFNDIDAKMLPRMLQVVQKYAKNVTEPDDDDEVDADSNPKVVCLSIVYEVMKWEKLLVLNL